MATAIQLNNRVKLKDRNCVGLRDEFLSARPRTKQARKNEALCVSCPALPECANYAGVLERWQKEGTIAGITYTKTKDPSFCEWCSKQFHPKRVGQEFCSNRCQSSRREQIRRVTLAE